MLQLSRQPPRPRVLLASNRRAQATAALLVAMACTASSIRADLPTKMLPVSRATFQVSPKSSRLTSVAALNPTRGLADRVSPVAPLRTEPRRTRGQLDRATRPDAG